MKDKRLTKIGDGLAIAYLTIVASLFVVFLNQFVAATKSHPFIMGFIKVGLLATFGEFLKIRLRIGKWKITHPIQRFIVWGLFGIWFTWGFPFVSFGTEGLIEKGLWFSFFPALSKSLWINIFGGFGFTVMVSHEYFNQSIEKQRFINLTEFADSIDRRFWFRYIPLTLLLLWTPMQTGNFSLPDYFQVLVAAALTIVLGFILTMGKKTKQI